MPLLLYAALLASVLVAAAVGPPDLLLKVLLELGDHGVISRHVRNAFADRGDELLAASLLKSVHRTSDAT